MSIYVKNFLWYANDGSHFVHPQHKRREVPGMSSFAAGSEVQIEPSSSKIDLGKSVVVEPGMEGSKAGLGNLDLDVLKNLIKETIKEEMAFTQFSQNKKIDEISEQFKKNLYSVLIEIKLFETLYDEFSDRVKKDLNHNVVAFDKLVDQMRKVGESVTTWFDQLDVNTDKSVQVVKDL